MSNVFIWTMSKVGTCSLKKSKAISPLIIGARHTLDAHDGPNGIDVGWLEKNASTGNANKVDMLRRLSAGNVNIITSVRDPIGRAISAFFYHIEYFTRLNRQKILSKSPSELKILFLDNFNHTWHEEWFDREIKKHTGIDVYKHEYPHSKGYSIIKGANNINLLVLRMEDLSRVADASMFDYLQIENKEADWHRPSSKGSAHWYGKKYGKFKTAKLPAAYVDSMYNSRLAKHFYLEEELESFKEKWS